MAKIDVTKTELVWPGKYKDDGTIKEVPRVSLPFQVIETVNESRATREAKKGGIQGGLIAYDKDLPEIPGRRPWEKPTSYLVKDDAAPSGWCEDTSGRYLAPPDDDEDEPEDQVGKGR